MPEDDLDSVENLLKKMSLKSNEPTVNTRPQASTSNSPNQLSPELIRQISELVINTVKKLNNPFVDTEDVEQHIDFTTNTNDTDKVPDIVKCLREFSGRPGEFNSWRKTVDRIFTMYDCLRGTSKYYAILHMVRHKIVGEADTALESYRTPLDWGKIKQCLMMHYSDKRDIGTLEYQLTSLAQRNQSITDFYQQVYQHLSLILDKIACLDLTDDSLGAMTNAYRDKALDTFIRGLNGDLPRLLSIREPTSLPQALHMCLKLDNMTYRMHYAHNSQVNFKRLTNTPTPQLPPRQNQTKFYPELAHIPRPQRQYFQQYNYQNRQPQQSHQYQAPHFNRIPLPPKPQPQPKVTPMELGSSTQSRNINYQNRPMFQPNYQQNYQKNYQQNNQQAPYAQKRWAPQQLHPPNKIQRTFFTETNPIPTDDDSPSTERYEPDQHDDVNEVEETLMDYIAPAEGEEIEYGDNFDNINFLD